MINNIEENKLNSSLFIFFLVLMSNFTMDRVLPNSLIKFLNKNRISKLIISYLFLLFCTNLYIDNQPFYKLVLFVTFSWFLFLIISKMYLIILLLLLISYICYNISDNLQYYKNLDIKKEEKIKYYLKKIQKCIFYVVIIITVIGGSVYFKDKYKLYRKKSKSLLSFIIKFYLIGSQDMV